MWSCGRCCCGCASRWAALALLAVGLAFGLHALGAKASAVEARSRGIETQTAAYQQEKQHNEARMRQPVNAAVLERSRFLNAVFARKSFSWTAVMMDLERVLPSGVQVTSIEPQITSDGAVNIRLRVSGDRDRAVQLVRNLETSSRFVGPRLSGEAAQQTNQLLQRTGLSGWRHRRAGDGAVRHPERLQSVAGAGEACPRAGSERDSTAAGRRPGGGAMNLGGAVTSQNFAERTRALLTLVNLHYAGAGLLLLLNVILGVGVFSAWRAASGQNAETMTAEISALHAAEERAKPLEGLDAKLQDATTDSDTFYHARLPYAYSQVAGELGALAKRERVKLNGVQYSQAPVMDATAGALTEVRMDASLGGDYRPLVLFVNGLERDRMFFVIGAVALTGQQSGMVGLRLRLTTYLRPPVGAEATEAAKVLPDADAAMLEGDAAQARVATGGAR